MFMNLFTGNANSTIELIAEPNGDLPMTIRMEKSSLPEKYPGPLRDAEAALRLMRALLDSALEEIAEAEKSGRQKKIEKATAEALDMGKTWFEHEVGVASLLVQSGIPLEGRSMIVLK